MTKLFEYTLGPYIKNMVKYVFGPSSFSEFWN